MPDHARMPMTALMRGGGRLSAPVGAGRGGSADQAVAKPFVKWAGGKRKLAPEIEKYIPKKFNNYWEPFVGGGAVFFHMHSEGKFQKRVFLSDANTNLIRAYLAIKDDPEKLIKMLREWQREHRKHGKYFYEAMKNYSPRSNTGFATKLIYYNKTCYNGLYRVNRHGRFNVPMGNYVNPKICDEKNIRSVNKLLNDVDVRIDNRSFEEIKPKPNDVVYCDPPYDGTFTAYTGNKFGSEDQERLCEKCSEWRDNGVYVIVSNNKTNFIKGIYKKYGFNAYIVKAARHINCDGSGRGKVEELIIIGRKASHKSSRARTTTKKGI